jgi:type I restriction enzyme S subunit
MTEWQNLKLGEIVSIKTGKIDANKAVDNGKYPFFTCAREISRIDDAPYEGKVILVAGNGDLNVKYYEGKFNAYQRTYFLTSLDETSALPKYIYFFMEHYLQILRTQSIGTTVKYIKMENLSDAIIPLPAIDEQHKIVEHLEDHLSRLDAALLDVRQAKIKASQFRMTVLHSIFNSSTNTEDWKSTSLEKIGVWKTGSTPLSKNPEFQGSDVKFVTPGDIGYGGKLNLVARTISSKGADSVRRISPPSVHLVCIGTIGKVAWTKEIVTTNQQINSLEVDASVNNPEFLMWLLASPGIQEKLWSSSSSTTVPILNKGNLEKIQCSLPSLETQNEIMKLIDSSFSKLEAVLETANQLENQSSVLRRSLLQAAFTGQLTKEVVIV